MKLTQRLFYPFLTIVLAIALPAFAEDAAADGAAAKSGDASAADSAKKPEKKKKEKKPKKQKAEKDSDKAAKDSSDKKADDATDGGNKPKEETSTKTDDAKPADAAAPAPKKAKSNVPWGKRLASFACGATLGFPAAYVRRTAHQTQSGTRDFIGESKNPIAWPIATVISLPYGMVGGFLEGWEHSILNSWRASREEPFSKDTFMLGEDDGGWHPNASQQQQ